MSAYPASNSGAVRTHQLMYCTALSYTAGDSSGHPSPKIESLSSPRSETSSTTDRAANPLVGDFGAGGTTIRLLSLPLGRQASLRLPERPFPRFGDCGEDEVGAFLSDGVEGARGGALPRALGCLCCCACALQGLFLSPRDGECGCGVVGRVRIGGFEIKSSSTKAGTPVAYEEETEGGLRITKSSDRGENKARSLSDRDETPQTISSSSELVNVEIWLPLVGERSSKESRDGRRTICVERKERVRRKPQP